MEKTTNEKKISKFFLLVKWKKNPQNVFHHQNKIKIVKKYYPQIKKKQENKFQKTFSLNLIF
jgi:hypothetical protein